LHASRPRPTKLWLCPQQATVICSNEAPTAVWFLYPFMMCVLCLHDMCTHRGSVCMYAQCCTLCDTHCVWLPPCSINICNW